MLSKVSEEIADCLARAGDARQCAAHEATEKIKAEWLEMEKRWLRIAQSLTFTERAKRFLDDAATAAGSEIRTQVTSHGDLE